MQSIENFVGETVSTYLYFYIDFVDGELADSLEEYLQEHVVNARDLDEAVKVGLEDRINASDVIRYEIDLANANLETVSEIKQLVTQHTNAWVESMGGKEAVN